MNKLIKLLIIFTVLISSLSLINGCSNESQKPNLQDRNKIFIQEIEKEFVNKKIAPQIDEFLNNNELNNNKTLLVIYIPEKFCYTCIEALFKRIKNNEYTLIVAKNKDNPSVLGFIKYYHLQNRFLIDRNDLFSEIYLKGEKIFSPLAILIHRKIIKEIKLLNDELTINKFFNKQKMKFH